MGTSSGTDIGEFDGALMGELDSPEAELLAGTEVDFQMWDEIWADFTASRTPHAY